VSDVRKNWTKTERTMLYIDELGVQSRMTPRQGMAPSIRGFKQTAVHVAYSGALGQEPCFFFHHCIERYAGDRDVGDCLDMRNLSYLDNTRIFWWPIKECELTSDIGRIVDVCHRRDDKSKKSTKNVMRARAWPA
jgi:hypothetical protein